MYWIQKRSIQNEVDIFTRLLIPKYDIDWGSRMNVLKNVGLYEADLASFIHQ